MGLMGTQRHNRTWASGHHWSCWWWIRLVERKVESWWLFDFGVQKYTLYSYYISNFIFAPTPPLHPALSTSGIPMTPVTVTVTIANESSPAKRRQPNKEEQKRGYFQFLFFMLNSNKYIKMQWFLFYPFLLSRRIKKFFFLNFCFLLLFISLLICVGSLAAIQTTCHHD